MSLLLTCVLVAVDLCVLVAIVTPDLACVFLLLTGPVRLVADLTCVFLLLVADLTFVVADMACLN